MKLKLRECVLFAGAAIALACAQRGPYDGLAPAEQTGGPRIICDQTSTPAAIPYPNDLAARADSTSRTGLRVNASVIAPTQLQTAALEQLDQLDGFGTYAPITVSFDADLDALDLYARQSDSDPANDAVYLIDLTSGATVPLDFNSGRFPAELPAVQPYFLNDPFAATTNLLFPSSGANANLLHPIDPNWPATHGGIPQASDDLLTFYERSTRTLILRPIFPLTQERSYAVVLTNRLHGTSGLSVQSPFSGINHALQTSELQPLSKFLPSGTQLSDVAFTWAFTTQSTTGDLEALEQGLEGNGVFQGLSLRFAVLDSSVIDTGLSRMVLLPEQGAIAQNPYIIPATTLIGLLSDPQLAGILTPADPKALQGLIQSLGYVDYFVSGNYPSPDLLADPDRAPSASAFDVDPPSGFVRTTFARVPFLLAVPKIDELHNHTPPFPVVIAGHDSGGSRLDPMLTVAGTFAQYGLATASIDAYGQGLAFDPATELYVRNVFHQHSLDDLANTLFTGRTRDLDGDGFADPAGDLFTANAFHTRDLIRQTVVDWLQLAVLLQSFTGNAEMEVPSQSEAAVAGDFNLDGVPDVGGPAVWPSDVSLAGTILFHANAANPGSDLFAFGVGTGGVVASIFAAVEPAVRAAAPVSTPGGLGDIALRTDNLLIENGQLLESFGPLLATCNFSPTTQSCGSAPDAISTLVWDGADTNRESIIPIAPLSLHPGDQVIACDLTQAPGAIAPDGVLAASPPAFCRTGLADVNGQLRLPLAADASFSLDMETAQAPGLPAIVQPILIRNGDQIRVLVVAKGASTPQVIDSFQYGFDYGDNSFSSGSPLRAISSGYGADRNTPGFRQLAGLWQAMAESGDPINYAPYLGPAPLAARAGVPVNLLAIATMGDAVLPVADQLAFGRAAGLIETQLPDPVYGVPIDQVLLEAAAAEGVARLPRFADPAAGPGLALGAHLVCNSPGDCQAPVVADLSDLSCGSPNSCSDGLSAPRLSPPIVQQLWRGTFTTSGIPLGISALELADFARQGQHGFSGPQPGKPFDLDLFLANQIGLYFSTRGATLELGSCQAQLAACPWNDYPPPY